MRSGPRSSGCRPTRSASSSSSSSGCAATPRRTPSKTNSRKSTTAASPTPTSSTRPVSRAGRPTAAASTLRYGPPDEMESHPSGGTYERPPEEGGGTTSTFPFETVALSLHRGHRQRHHHRIRRPDHVGRVPHDDGSVRKGRAAVRPGAGLTLMEQMGMSSKTDRFNRTDGTHLGVPFGGETAEDEPVQPPGAVRQTAARRRRSSSRIWRRRSIRASATTSCR